MTLLSLGRLLGLSQCCKSVDYLAFGTNPAMYATIWIVSGLGRRSLLDSKMIKVLSVLQVRRPDMGSFASLVVFVHVSTESSNAQLKMSSS
jgi:hypothetical protein